MKRIVVTGAQGGTGRSIVRLLKSVGYDVLGIDVQPAAPGDQGAVCHDLTEGAGVNDLLAGADGVVHFGSLPTDESTSRTEAFENIILGGFNVLQACANVGIKRLAYASSTMVYGDLLNPPHLPITENTPLSATGIYGSAKIMLESLATDFARWHDISIAAFRLSRIVYEDSFAVRLERHTMADDSAADVLWGYVDARDVASACQAWLESDLTGFRPFNIAAADVCVETPTKELLSQFFAHVKDAGEDFHGHSCPFDTSALRQALGWSERYNWRQLRDGA